MIEEGYCQCGCGKKTPIAMRTRGAIGWKKGEPLNYINGHNGRGADRQKYDGGPDFVAPDGYCQCGCGYKTQIAPQGSKKYGWVAGQPLRFIHGHNGRGEGTGECFSKRDGRWLADRGDGVFVLRSRAVMQNHLGRMLGSDDIVHHINENPLDDRLENLEVISRADHMRLHAALKQMKGI
jgi:HNH endonuclease